MIEMGAQKVHAFDLNKVIESKYIRNLDSRRYNITTGTVLNCPFEDEYFEVFCFVL